MQYGFSSNPYRHVNTSEYVAFQAVQLSMEESEVDLYIL
jgi:hypothetical protein